MSPTAYRLALLAIYAVAAVVFFVAMGVVGMVVDEPSRWLAASVRRVGGAPGLIAAVAIGLGGLYALAGWARRRDERRQIAQTGILHVEKPADIDMRRAVPQVLLWTSPLYLAAFVLFLFCVYVTVRGPA